MSSLGRTGGGTRGNVVYSKDDYNDEQEQGFDQLGARPYGYINFLADHRCQNTMKGNLYNLAMAWLGELHSHRSSKHGQGNPYAQHCLMHRIQIMSLFLSVVVMHTSLRTTTSLSVLTISCAFARVAAATGCEGLLLRYGQSVAPPVETTAV